MPAWSLFPIWKASVSSFFFFYIPSLECRRFLFSVEKDKIWIETGITLFQYSVLVSWWYSTWKSLGIKLVKKKSSVPHYYPVGESAVPVVCWETKRDGGKKKDNLFMKVLRKRHLLLHHWWAPSKKETKSRLLNALIRPSSIHHLGECVKRRKGYSFSGKQWPL